MIIPSVSNGITEISNILNSDDVMHTLNAIKAMGVKTEQSDKKLVIFGNGLNSLIEPKNEIYLGNSGTSARLFTGLLSSQKFKSIITGDKSLSKRPMRRISDPLSKMNAKIYTSDGKLPMRIEGSELNPANIDLKIPSAQIKSGILLASLNTRGESKIIEHKITRDHTEIMLSAFGAEIQVEKFDGKKLIKINGQKELTSKNIEVPNDLSSSAFIVASLINDNSRVCFKI